MSGQGYEWTKTVDSENRALQLTHHHDSISLGSGRCLRGLDGTSDERTRSASNLERSAGGILDHLHCEL